ncbi:MAG TPA: molybdenum cofactor biosynthesis protein MoaE [Vulgatibacteraceae bacterium]|nr:molybdenum cofactor biosynthesis protein MoaE [Vulgatibacteraceae bacterium]
MNRNGADDQNAAGRDAPGRDGVIRLLGVRETPLSLDEVYDAVQAPGAGAVAVFTGTVRDHDHARAVTALSYSAHPTAEQRLRAVMEKIAADHPVIALAAVHRVGDLRVGDIAVIAAASGAHRPETFDACRRLIDDLKAEVPIWKHQTFADGGDEWVGAC